MKGLTIDQMSIMEWNLIPPSIVYFRVKYHREIGLISPRLIKAGLLNIWPIKIRI